MIEFLDLKKINIAYEAEFNNVFKAFLNSGQYILGDQVSRFELEFAKFCGTKQAIATSTGLDAIKLIFEGFKVLGKLNDGDEVLVPANTYIASVLAISHAGLKPVLVMPNPSTFNIEAKAIEQKITPKTKAVLGVHLYGNLYDFNEIHRVCDAHDLLLIEDAAQAHGAVYSNGKKAGNLSDAAAFSFYPTKNLGALGDAGGITTNNDHLANVLLKLRNYGRSESYVNDFKGYNNRMDEIQAAILRVKLKQLDDENEKRKAIAKIYLNGINTNKVQLPKVTSDNAHVFHLFVIKSEFRDALKSYLLENNVQTMIHYPLPIHRQKAYKELNGLAFNELDSLHNQILSLPLNTSLTKTEATTIVDLINKF
ncbi:aminotransferase [Tamlana sedimentorum]|uniref:Aminotransferase n=1 Tax=Neotamlana sedimentorum TaxID=1435349 RepID=A0A0D7WBE0_9FLAO|nr:aminotransferase class I/II-fold pyridoxal phosphate-dependent enzyme [Tamlana sedimentorum]KJD35067.1 aminotransferase [Tamlana sedimentorum]